MSVGIGNNSSSSEYWWEILQHLMKKLATFLCNLHTTDTEFVLNTRPNISKGAIKKRPVTLLCIYSRYVCIMESFRCTQNILWLQCLNSFVPCVKQALQKSH